MNEQPSFNLIDRNWIKVLGRAAPVSLREVLSDPELKKLGGDPVEKIVVTRLLLAIAHAALEIPDEDAWHRLDDRTLSAEVLTYLERWHDRFDLFGEKPFLQFPQLDKGNVLAMGTTSVNVASGNKTVLTGWQRAGAYHAADCAYALLRQSCYGCGGKRYDNDLVLSPGYDRKSAAGKGGTLLGYIGYLHALLLGRNLLETIRFNLLTAAEVAGMAVFTGGIGRPFWEAMPEGENCGRSREYLTTYQGELFPLDKFLLLRPDGIVMTDGIAYPNHKSGLIDPGVTFRQEKSDVKAVWASTAKRPWRELPSLLMFLDSAKSMRMPYFVSCGIAKLRQSDAGDVALWTGGMQVSSNSGEQYLSGRNDLVESEFELAVDRLAEPEFKYFCSLMEELNRYSAIVYKAIAGYYQELNLEQGGGIASEASSAFWEMAETQAQRCLDIAFGDDAGRDAGSEKLFQDMRQAVEEVYRDFCPNDTPRQLTAWVKSMPNFRKSTKK